MPYAARDSIRYALGCGLGSDPLDVRELRFVYERDLMAFPAMACVFTAGFDTLRDSGVDFTKVVHTEQRLEMHSPLPPQGEVVAQWAVEEVIDKESGKGAPIVPARGSLAPHLLPHRTPNGAANVTVRPQIALLYRPSGDANPQNADPEVARRADFAQPILHGWAPMRSPAAPCLRRL